MLNNLAIILTARSASERLPNKIMADVAGYPLIYWMIRRLSTIGQVIFATTDDDSDNSLASYVSAMDVPVYRGSTDDVVGRMDTALAYEYPHADYVLRGLGDCPFLCGELVERAVATMTKYHTEAFAWALQPWVSPVYGCREFPYSREGWDRLVASSAGDRQCREHVDRYFALHRDEFTVSYHEPPPSIYFRDYRLEIDYQYDLDMVRALAKQASMMSNTRAIIEALDRNPEIAQINRMCVEKTGLSCYTYKQKREWAKIMKNKPIVGWGTNILWRPPGPRAELIHCDSGQCWIGFAEDGIIHTRSGDMIQGNAMLTCKCGAGRRWKATEQKEKGP
jgi:spore coat polysaccharide biosynthesis protein SpsF